MLNTLELLGSKLKLTIEATLFLFPSIKFRALSYLRNLISGVSCTKKLFKTQHKKFFYLNFFSRSDTSLPVTVLCFRITCSIVILSFSKASSNVLLCSVSLSKS